MDNTVARGRNKAWLVYHNRGRAWIHVEDLRTMIRNYFQTGRKSR